MSSELDMFFDLEPEPFTAEDHAAVADEKQFREMMIRDSKTMKAAIKYSIENIGDLKTVTAGHTTQIAVIKERSALLSILFGAVSGLATGMIAYFSGKS